MWRVDYDNDTGPDDGGFWEWWTVSNEATGMSFTAHSLKEAEWLLKILNNLEAKP